MAASRVVGARVIGPCLPIMRGVVAMTCARAGGEVRWGGIVERSRFRMIGGGHRWSREAPGLRVRPDDPGRSSRGSVIRQGLQTCSGRWRRSCNRSGVNQAPSGMCDRVDHGVPFCREFCSGGAESGIECINAVGRDCGNSVLKIRFGRLPSRVEVRLSCVSFVENASIVEVMADETAEAMDAPMRWSSRPSGSTAEAMDSPMRRCSRPSGAVAVRIASSTAASAR